VEVCYEEKNHRNINLYDAVDNQRAHQLLKEIYTTLKTGEPHKEQSTETTIKTKKTRTVPDSRANKTWVCNQTGEIMPLDQPLFT
jgi:predicted transcriptional regulator